MGSVGAAPDDVPGLLAEAAARAGHGGWGDTGFVEPLSLLVGSCRATGNLSPAGWRVLRSVVLRHLRNRLYLRAYLERHGDAGTHPPGSPLVITGLPRTGTSLLHNLLAQDPRHRFLRLWEGLHPAPPGPPGPSEATLVGQAERWLDRFYERVPEFRAIHPLTARGPEECDSLLQNAFASQHFDDMFDAPEYSRWFWHGTPTAQYRDYALQLRVLSAGLDGRRWLLKSPGHLGHLGALLEVLPGARILHCHRDPVRAVPSYASLIRAVRRRNVRVLSLPALGQQALERCSTALHRALEVRSAAREDRFLDVGFRALTADPIGTVQRVYDWVGDPLDGTVADAMRAWLDAHPPDRHGTHRYTAERFGLSAHRVRTFLAAYLERFGAVAARA